METLTYKQFLAKCLQNIPEAEREKWLEQHEIIPGFQNQDKWLINI